MNLHKCLTSCNNGRQAMMPAGKALLLIGTWFARTIQGEGVDLLRFRFPDV